MEGGSLLSVQGLGDKHVAADGIYVVDATRGLIGSCSGDAVADADILILIWADLKTQKQRNMLKKIRKFSLLALQVFNKGHKLFRAV